MYRLGYREGEESEEVKEEDEGEEEELLNAILRRDAEAAV